MSKVMCLLLPVGIEIIGWRCLFEIVLPYPLWLRWLCFVVDEEDEDMVVVGCSLEILMEGSNRSFFTFLSLPTTLGGVDPVDGEVLTEGLTITPLLLLLKLLVLLLVSLLLLLLPTLFVSFG